MGTEAEAACLRLGDVASVTAARKAVGVVWGPRGEATFPSYSGFLLTRLQVLILPTRQTSH